MIFTLKFFCFPIAFHIFIIRPFFHYFYKTLYFDRHFRTKGTLKMPFGVYPKNHFKIPRILREAGSQLKIFLHVPLREILISFQGQEWGPGGRFFLCAMS